MAVIDAAAWQPAPRRRIMIASHSHPALSNGGSEIAAFHLFRTLQARDDVETWFLGCDRLAVAEKPGAVFSQPYSDREYIYAVNEFEWFKFANRDTRFPAEIEQLLTELRPDVIHFHHFINFGVEVFEHVKRALPACRIVLTLHEYLAICHHYGQMITKGHRNLCYEATPSRCQGCFPDIAKSDFFLRKLYIERFSAWWISLWRRARFWPSDFWHGEFRQTK